MHKTVLEQSFMKIMSPIFFFFFWWPDVKLGAVLMAHVPAQGARDTPFCAHIPGKAALRSSCCLWSPRVY